MSAPYYLEPCAGLYMPGDERLLPDAFAAIEKTCATNRPHVTQLVIKALADYSGAGQQNPLDDALEQAASDLAHADLAVCVECPDEWRRVVFGAFDTLRSALALARAKGA